MSDVERLRRKLEGATTIAAVKRVYDRACALTDEAVAARDRYFLLVGSM